MGNRRPVVVVHPLAPLYDASSRVLLLGSMPSPRSRERRFYYAHPQNRFWPVMAEVLGEPLPPDDGGRAAMLLGHGVALWDVIARCEIVGASDASIRNPQPNDLTRILCETRIGAIFATGSVAARLYRRLLEPMTDRPVIQLPSTSPANARIRTTQLVDAYAQIRDWLA